MTENQIKRQRRPVQPMPEFVRNALTEKGLMNTYNSRPPYQRNDYIGWIIRAKQEKTQQKRLNQMLDELTTGDRYMNMKHRANKPRSNPETGS